MIAWLKRLFGGGRSFVGAPTHDLHMAWITRVPDRAKPVGVKVGMRVVVIRIDEDKQQQEFDERRLVKVRIPDCGNWEFAWSMDDLSETDPAQWLAL